MIKQLVGYLLIAVSITVSAQIDREFWFVAPAVTPFNNLAGGQPVYFVITTAGAPATVTIEQPANASFNDTTFKINSYSLVRYVMTYSQIANEYASLGGVPGKNNKGFHITSDAPISIVYEYGNTNNAETYSLKGTNGLGTEFFTVFQNHMYNQNLNWAIQAYSAFDIVATEPGVTNITIETPVNIYGYVGQPTFNISLNQGETFTAIPAKTTVPPNGWQASDVYGRAGPDHLTGCRVVCTNGKKIAITLKDDSQVSLINTSISDLCGDQAIPLATAGTEYIAVKGLLLSDLSNKQERVYITGTQNGDSIFVNDTFFVTLNRGQTRMWDNFNTAAAHIRTKSKSFVLQVTGIDNDMGSDVLPPLNQCTGSTTVTLTRTSSNPFYLYIIVRKGAHEKFQIDGLPSAAIPGSAFSNIPGTDDWMAARLGPINTSVIPVNIPVTISNIKDVFHLAVMNGLGNYTARFSFLTDYNPLSLVVYNTQTGNKSFSGCYGDSVQLVAQQGTNITWSPVDYLNDSYIHTPIAFPRQHTVYTVQASGACNTVFSDSVDVYISTPIKANYTINPSVNCAPAILTINADLRMTRKAKWDFGNGSATWSFADTVSFDTTFSQLYLNATFTPLIYNSRLIVLNNDNCSDTLIRPIIINPQVSASFTASDTVGCHPLTVAFTNTSTGNTDPAKYKWEFGDNGSSTEISPVHEYVNTGGNDTIYPVRLIAGSPYFCYDTVTASVIVHPVMNVNFTLDTTRGCVTLDAIISNLSLGVDTFHLDFGDGQDTLATTFSIFTHTYTNTGLIPDTFDIVLTGWNTQGCRDTVIRQVVIYPPAQASFTFSPLSACDSSLVQFTNTSTGYGLTYLWDFGDTNTSSAIDPVHLYQNRSMATINYIVHLMIESANFCRDTITDTIPIFPYLNADFGITDFIGCPPFTAQYINRSIGASAYTWHFGDGTQSLSSADTITNIYYNNSFINDTVYHVKLVIQNTDGCTDSIEKQISVYPDIEAGFYPDTNRSCDPAVFTFTSTSQGVSFYFWDFGDGATSEQNNSVVHGYEKNLSSGPDTLPVTLFVQAINNTCNAVKDSFVIINPVTQAIFVVDDYIDCTPFANRFNNVSVGTTNTYLWYINGINIPTAPADTADFVYSFVNVSDTAELYRIRLVSTNAEGCTSFFEDTAAVYPSIVANFGANPGYSGCHPLVIQFSDSSIFAEKFTWDFGDSTVSNSQNPVHQFRNFSNTSDTTYTVKFKVETDNCSDSVFRIITVHANPKARIDVDSAAACSPFMLSVTNSSTISAGNYYWDMGDGFFDTLSSAGTFTYTYHNYDSVIRFYVIRLTALTAFGCIDSTQSVIQAYPEVTADFISDTSGCNPFDVQFFNRSKNAYQYVWNFNNMDSTSVVNPPYRFYNESNIDLVYTVWLHAVSQYGCSHDTSKTIRVFARPEAEFSVSPVNQRYEVYPSVKYTNLTPYRTTWTYSWDFGDASSGTQQADTFSHEYHIWGPNNDYNRLYLTLIAYNADSMCRDTSRQIIRIFPPVPEATITSDVDSGCPPLTVHLIATAPINDAGYIDTALTRWEMDDGTVLTGSMDITYTYTAFGVFNIMLEVTGDGGTNKEFYNIEAFRLPVIDFDVDPKFLMLPNANMQCFNSTKYADRYEWYANGTQFSTEEKPMYQFSDSGVYDIMLIGYTSKGCSDTLIKSALITVQDPGKVVFPNAFLPDISGPNGGKYYNGEEKVTVFYPLTKGVDENFYLFQIFNRWGEILFETTDLYTGWDGYYHNRLCKQDVYIWKVKGKFLNGQGFEEVGTVTLLRGK